VSLKVSFVYILHESECSKSIDFIDFYIVITESWKLEKKSSIPFVGTIKAPSN